MKNEYIRIGLEVYVDSLRPKWSLISERREEGLQGIVIDEYKGWAPGAWVVRHHDGTIGRYYYDELEPETMIYWYKVRKIYGYQ